MRFIPHGARVLIRPDEIAKKIGSLEIPEIARGEHTRTRTGTVVAMGPGMLIIHGARVGQCWPMPDGKTPELMPDLHGKKVVYLAGTGQTTDILIDDVVHHIVFDDTLDAYIADDGATMPLYDRVLVKRLDAATRAGLIWIPETSQETRAEGIVISTGPGRMSAGGVMRKLDVQPGNHVLFGKYQGIELKVAGEQRLMLREDDILGVVERDIAEELPKSDQVPSHPGGP
jgi:chaperonin GroES